MIYSFLNMLSAMHLQIEISPPNMLFIYISQ